MLSDGELKWLVFWGRAKKRLGWAQPKSVGFINVRTGQKFRKRLKGA